MLRDSLNVGEDLSRDSGDEGNSQGYGDDACEAHNFVKAMQPETLVRCILQRTNKRM